MYITVYGFYLQIDCKILYNLYSVIFDISEERCAAIIQFAKK